MPHLVPLTLRSIAAEHIKAADEAVKEFAVDGYKFGASNESAFGVLARLDIVYKYLLAAAAEVEKEGAWAYDLDMAVVTLIGFLVAEGVDPGILY